MTEKKSFMIFWAMRWHFFLTAAFAASLYPLHVLICYCSGYGSLSAILLTAADVLLVWLGMLAVVLLRRMCRRKPKRFRLIVWTMTIVLALAGWISLPFSVGLLRLICGIAAGGCFYGGVYLCHVATQDMTGPYVFTGLCLWNILIYCTSMILHVPVSVLPMVLILAGIMALFAVIRNRAALENVLHGRDGEIWELPQEIRRSNSGMLALLCGIGFVLICSYPLLARLLRWLWRTLRDAALRLFIWLMSLGGGTPEERMAEEYSPPQTVETLENHTPGWVQPLIYAVLFISVLALLFWKRREVWNGIVRFWCSLCRWLRGKLNSVYDADDIGVEHAYCDYVEDLLIKQQSESCRTENSGHRRWKRLYRKYCRMPENAERFRLGYGLAVARLPEAFCVPSDSVEDILRKMGEQACAPHWNTISESYNRVRYGEFLPESADFEALNLLLQKMYRKK